MDKTSAKVIFDVTGILIVLHVFMWIGLQTNSAVTSFLVDVFVFGVFVYLFMTVERIIKSMITSKREEVSKWITKKRLML